MCLFYFYVCIFSNYYLTGALWKLLFIYSFANKTWFECCNCCIELLPGIEAFLVYTLAAEHLSQAAEQQRRYYVDCFAKTKSQLTTSIVEHRAVDEVRPDLIFWLYFALLIIRSSYKELDIFMQENVYDPVDGTQNGSVNSSIKLQILVAQNIWAFLWKCGFLNRNLEVENIYEVPIADDDEGASDSDTSYESYDDETFSNDNENIYVNAVQLNGYSKLRLTIILWTAMRLMSIEFLHCYL